MGWDQTGLKLHFGDMEDHQLDGEQKADGSRSVARGRGRSRHMGKADLFDSGMPRTEEGLQENRRPGQERVPRVCRVLEP